MGKKKYGDAGGQVRQRYTTFQSKSSKSSQQQSFHICNAKTSQRSSQQVNKFSTQLNPVAGGAWNFAARFLLSAAAGDPQVMSGDVR